MFAVTPEVINWSQDTRPRIRVGYSVMLIFTPIVLKTEPKFDLKPKFWSEKSFGKLVNDVFNAFRSALKGLVLYF